MGTHWFNFLFNVYWKLLLQKSNKANSFVIFHPNRDSGCFRLNQLFYRMQHKNAFWAYGIGLVHFQLDTLSILDIRILRIEKSLSLRRIRSEELCSI